MEDKELEEYMEYMFKKQHEDAIKMLEEGYEAMLSNFKLADTVEKDLQDAIEIHEQDVMDKVKKTFPGNQLTIS